MYVAFEFTIIPILIRIYTLGYQPERLIAARFLMVFNLTLSTPIIILIINLKNSFGTLNIYLINNYIVIHDPFLEFWGFLFLLNFLIKVPLFGLHAWLPKVHVESSTLGSILLAAIYLKLGLFGIIQINRIINYNYIHLLCIWVIWTSVILSIYIFRLIDIKSIIALSSVCHIRFIILAINMKLTIGQWPIYILIFSHGMCASGLFFIAGLLYLNIKTRNIYLIKNIILINPIIRIYCLILLLFNFRCPPFISFMGEIFIVWLLLYKRIFMCIILIIRIFMISWLSIKVWINLFNSKNQNLNIPFIKTNISYNQSFIIYVMYIIVAGVIISIFFIK